MELHITGIKELCYNDKFGNFHVEIVTSFVVMISSDVEIDTNFAEMGSCFMNRRKKKRLYW